MLSVRGARPFAVRCWLTSVTTCCAKDWLSVLPLLVVPAALGVGVAVFPLEVCGAAVTDVPVLFDRLSPSFSSKLFRLAGSVPQLALVLLPDTALQFAFVLILTSFTL